MTTLLIILLVIFSIAIGLFILVQNPKDGGLTTGGSSSNMFGVKRTGDVLEKGTWTLMALIVVASLAITVIGKSGGSSSAVGSSKIDEHINKAAVPSPIGGNLANPATTPAKSADSTKK